MQINVHESFEKNYIHNSMTVSIIGIVSVPIDTASYLFNYTSEHKVRSNKVIF